MANIVQAVDDEVDRSLEQAQAILEFPVDTSSIEVTIVHAFDYQRPDDEVTNLESVQEVASLYDDHGVSYEIEGQQAEPTELVLEVAASVDADLISVGGRKRTPVGKALFGSVAQQIILGTDLPVLVAGEPTTESEE